MTNFSQRSVEDPSPPIEVRMLHALATIMARISIDHEWGVKSSSSRGDGLGAEVSSARARPLLWRSSSVLIVQMQPTQDRC